MKLTTVELPYINSADLFDKVSDQPWAVFLDSGVVDASDPINSNANYDLLAFKPHTTLVFDDGVTRFVRGGLERELRGDPMLILRSAIPSVEEPIKYPYMPGALGYFSYDLARQYETLPTHAEDDEQLPAMAMGIYHVVVVVDHIECVTWLMYLGNSAETLSIQQEWQELIECLFEDSLENARLSNDDKPHDGQLLSGMFEENMDQAYYEKCFDDVRRYTIDGDCYQVNLAKRFSAMVAGDAWLTYRYLRQLSPAPYGAYINLPFAQVLSNSPESFIQCRDRNVVTSPIKGTRPRDHTNAKLDKIIAKTLVQSVKDRAENLMIVDLMRNDLSKCCELNSVKVPALFEIHSFANVHHLISTVTGKLRKELHSLDLLRTCFPGGSITGAPKIRAMEIIEELEPHRRGLYCGAIGYVGVNGDLETNIAIRTIVVKDGVARYSAGGGLVIDSKLDEEYQEIVDKASMMTDALFTR